MVTQTITTGSRVLHDSPTKCYGGGVVDFIHPPARPGMPPTFAQVRFDFDAPDRPGRRHYSRRVWIHNLQSEPERRVIWRPTLVVNQPAA